MKMMEEESNSLHSLPPLKKRFKLIHQQQQKQDHQTIHNPPKSTQNNHTPLPCLPAKKRKQPQSSESPLQTLPPTPPTFSLPAKKRVLALHPFDLNLEYTHQYHPIQEKPELDSKPTSEINQIIITTTNNNNNNNNNKPEEDVDDGIACVICNSTDGDPEDPIVLCDGCELMVHASCYGHPFTGGIPSGEWFCAQCLEALPPGFKNKNKKRDSASCCCLCPVGGGAMKKTTDGRWAHVVCAIYVPEVYFEDAEGREGVELGKVLRKRWEKECCVCGTRNGCVVDCSEPKCGLGFHVGCGLKEEFCVEYREGRGRGGRGGGGVVAGFCARHTDLWKKQEQTGKFKIVAREEK